MSQAKLLHVLGGGPWQVPTVKLAKALGLRVLVTDMYSERPAYALADAHEVVDITDREETLAAARRHGVDGVICDTTDVGVPTAAYVAERLGLPGMGHETALNCTNKARMRECVQRAGLVTPRHVTLVEPSEIEKAVEAVGLPLVAKPVDNQSGRGVSIVSRGNEAVAAFQRAKALSRSGTVLFEAMVSGVEIIVDGFVLEGRCTVLGIARKVPYVDNPTVSSRILYEFGWSLPISPDRVESACAATVAAVGLNNGVFHAEFIVGPVHIVPIDFAARGGGVMIYRHAVPHVSGVAADRAMIELAVGQPVRIAAMSPKRAANIEFIRAPAGILDQVIGTEDALKVPGIAALHLNIEPGSAVGPLTHKDDRLGFLVALGATTEQVVEAAEAAKSRLSVRMRGHNEATPVQ